MLALVSLVLLGGTDFSTGMRWLVCLLLLIGILAQSGGMFLHAFTGQAGQWSRGNTLTAGRRLARRRADHPRGRCRHDLSQLPGLPLGRSS